MGTGYLGWSPEVTLSTPIPQILLAMEGRFDFALKTNPFGGKPKKEPSDEAKAKKAAQREKFMLYRMDARHKGKK